MIHTVTDSAFSAGKRSVNFMSHSQWTCNSHMIVPYFSTSLLEKSAFNLIKRFLQSLRTLTLQN